MFATELTSLFGQLVERCTGIAEVKSSNPVQAWIFFSGLIFITAQVVFSTVKISFTFTSLSAVQIYDFYIFTVVYSSLHGFIWNQHNGQLPVGLLAQLVGHCTGIAEVMGSNPVQAWIFFRPYFHYYSSSVHNCEDRFHIHVQVLLLTDKLWSIYTLLRDRNLIFQPFVLIPKA